MDAGQLPPWQQLPYFQTPRGRSLTPSPGVGTQVVGYDNMRVLLAIVCSSGQAVVSTEYNDTVNSKGIILIPNSLPLVIDHYTWGPLCNAEWWVNTNGSIYFWTVSLSKWPQPGIRATNPPQPAWYKRLYQIVKGG